MKKLEKGEKYLSIKIVGHDYIVAFPNKEKTNPEQPDFKSDGVAVWVREKQEEQKEKLKEKQPIAVYNKM